jgi:hypothetical protein
MTDIDFPPALVGLQRRVHEAWAAVEAHRKGVDAERRTDAETSGERIDPSRPALRSWTEAEDARHAELMAAARDAGEALRRGLAEAGFDGRYDVVQGLHAAARGE